ncbi:hypothetical protein ElyMa_006935400, partial [Elysia marginata]
ILCATARSGGRSIYRRKSKMAHGLAGPVSQSSAVKPALPMGVIMSYVVVVGAQVSIDKAGWTGDVSMPLQFECPDQSYHDVSMWSNFD